MSDNFVTMTVNQAVALIEEVYFLQINTGVRFAIELIGPPGVGKDDGIAQAAARIAARLAKPFKVRDFFLTTVESPDIRGFGLPGKDTNGDAIMQFTKAPWAPRANDPEHGFVFLNEFGQASHDVAKPSAELFLNGRVGDTSLPITYMVIAASNRERDRSGVGRGLAFINNRKMEIHVRPDLDSWVDWAERKGINPFAIAFAKFKPNVIFGDEVPEKPGPFCTPRTFCKVAHMIGTLPIDMFTIAAQGYMGAGAGAELVAFLRVAEELPKWEEIVKDPEKVRIPKERVDATYAAMQMVAHRVDPSTAKPAFTFLKRLGREFQVAGLKAVLRRCPTMVQSPDFAAWLRENKELVMATNLLNPDRKGA
jgi:hypothetical protein